jgi:hypothetical protein
MHPGAPRYCLIRNGLMEKHKLDQADVFKASTMMQDIQMLEDDDLTVSGISMIQDVGKISLSFFRSMSPTLMKKAMTCFQQGNPYRIKGAHFFNLSPAFETIHNFMKPFLTEKLKKRVSESHERQLVYLHILFRCPFTIPWTNCMQIFQRKCSQKSTVDKAVKLKTLRHIGKRRLKVIGIGLLKM